MEIPEAVKHILLRPLITEKATAAAGANATYTFVIPTHVGRVEVAQAIALAYQVRPVSVRVMQVRGKVVRTAGITGQRSSWKKAMVTLPKGKTIDIYPGV